MVEPVEGEEFFGTDAQAVSIYRALGARLLAWDGVRVRVTKSQIAFRAHRGFAYAWRPGAYVDSDVPVVLSLALPDRLQSDRFKEVAHPADSTWMHHVELRLVKDVDREVISWARQAYRHALGASGTSGRSGSSGS